MGDPRTRTEHDLLGAVEVPAGAYYGAHTARAVANFPVSGDTLADHPALIRALSDVKRAAAAANHGLGLLGAEKTAAIIAACADVRAGELDAEFPLPLVQGGAGTSTNMNANEVIANRALHHLGHSLGDYAHLHPLDDVNQGQSTNDVYPTAVKLALDAGIGSLIAAVSRLRAAFEAKAAEFSDTIKIGRTQLQDAVPMTLGQEFAAYAVTLGEDADRLVEARSLLHELNLGGTAIGTALNSPDGYQSRVLAELREITGIRTLSAAPDLVEATQDAGVFVQLSGVLKRVAVKLSKTCNDLRLLSSGPRAGLNEIGLPAVQAGSSIMPGKVNPVIPELVNQIAFEVIGHDVTVTMAAEAGQLQLNAFGPVIARSLFASVDHLTSGCAILADRCVAGITADARALGERVRESIGLATVLNPVLGYAKATAIAQEALSAERNVAELVAEQGLLTPDQIEELLTPARLTGRPAL